MVQQIPDLKLNHYNIFSVRNGFVLMDNIFKAAKDEMYDILNDYYINKLEVVKGGGNECPFVSRLKEKFVKSDWRAEINGMTSQRIRLVKKVGKSNFKSLPDYQRVKEGKGYYEIIYEKETRPSTHKVDVIKSYPYGRIGLDIEWNSKDSIYDRDLTNFQWLYQYGFIDLGIIITRGESLVEKLKEYIVEYYDSQMPFDIKDINNHTLPGDEVTKRQIKDIEDRFATGKYSIPQAVGSILYLDKYGESTTHYSKLENKINQGKGGFCPLVIITIEKERIV